MPEPQPVLCDACQSGRPDACSGTVLVAVNPWGRTWARCSGADVVRCWFCDEVLENVVFTGADAAHTECAIEAGVPNFAR